MQRSLDHLYAVDGLLAHASSIARSGVKPSYHKIDTGILQRMAIYYAFSRASTNVPFSTLSRLKFVKFIYSRPFFFMIGFYYPPFYLQLDASEHGINQTLTFYSVCVIYAFPRLDTITQFFFFFDLARHNERSKLNGTSLIRFFCSFSWCRAHDSGCLYLFRCPDIQYGNY